MGGEMSSHQADAVMYSLRCVSLPIAAVAIINSMALIFAHARENKHPALRVRTVRILLMVVIDSLAAVVGMWAIGWAPALDPLVENAFHFLVELYESVVIFSFLHFVLICGGGPERLAGKFARREPDGQASMALDSAQVADGVVAEAGQPGAGALGAAPAQGDVEGRPPTRSGSSLSSQGAQSSDLEDGSLEVTLPGSVMASAEAEAPLRKLHHLPLLGRVLPEWRSGEQMLRWCVNGTLSYVVVGAALAFFGVVLWVVPVDLEHKGTIWKVSCLVLSAAQALAILSLGELAVNVKDEISLLRPYGKFLSVKFVVFFGFWQGMVLQGLLKLGLFDGFERGCGAKCAVTAVQNTLLCIEMLAASIAHFYVFPPHDYLRLLAQNRVSHGETSPASLGSPATFVEVVDIRDIFSTALEVHRAKPRASPDAEKAPNGEQEADVEAASSAGATGSPRSVVAL